MSILRSGIAVLIICACSQISNTTVNCFSRTTTRKKKKRKKNPSSLSHKEHCDDYLLYHLGPICSDQKADHLTSTEGLVWSFEIFHQVPTQLFVDIVPSWHWLEYVSVCVSACVCVCIWRVGVCVEWKAVRMESWMTQTGQSRGRLVSGPSSHHQAGCSIWQLTESLQAPTLHSPTKRSVLQSALPSGHFLSHRCTDHAPFSPVDAHMHLSGRSDTQTDVLPAFMWPHVILALPNHKSYILFNIKKYHLSFPYCMPLLVFKSCLTNEQFSHWYHLRQLLLARWVECQEGCECGEYTTLYCKSVKY